MIKDVCRYGLVMTFTCVVAVVLTTMYLLTVVIITINLAYDGTKHYFNTIKGDLQCWKYWE